MNVAVEWAKKLSKVNWLGILLEKRRNMKELHKPVMQKRHLATPHAK